MCVRDFSTSCRHLLQQDENFVEAKNGPLKARPEVSKANVRERPEKRPKKT